MDAKDLRKAVDEFFGDTSRPAQETKEVLLDLAETMQMLASSIPDEEDTSSEDEDGL